MTERDIFFAINTSLYSPYELDRIYTKYRYVALIAWEPISSNAFYDYISGQNISLEKLNEDFNDYTPMALQKLSVQLEKALNRWQYDIRAIPFRQLYERIKNLLDRIIETDAIIV